MIALHLFELILVSLDIIAFLGSKIHEKGLVML